MNAWWIVDRSWWILNGWGSLPSSLYGRSEIISWLIDLRLQSSSAFGTGHVFGDQPDLEFRGSWDWAAMDGIGKHPNKSRWFCFRPRKIQKKNQITWRHVVKLRFKGPHAPFECNLPRCSRVSAKFPRVFIFLSRDLPRRIGLLVLLRGGDDDCKDGLHHADPAGGRTRASKILEQECRDYMPITAITDHVDHCFNTSRSSRTTFQTCLCRRWSFCKIS